MFTLLCLLLARSDPVISYSRAGAQVVEIDLRRVRVKVGLAQGLVGRTAELADIAANNGAVAAINGSFFEAYLTGPVKSPNHPLMSDGRWLNLGNSGSLLAFSSTNEVRMSRAGFMIEGGRNGSYSWPDRWFAYWLNRLPSAGSVTIFDRDWGSTTGISGGVQVVVVKGIVTKIDTGPQDIPRDGFVIAFYGGAEPSLMQSFKIGQRAEYRIVERSSGRRFWPEAREVIGAGPTLISDGRIALDPAAEKFHDPKILTGSGMRSAIGVTASHRLLLVAASGTLARLASTMKSLGCIKAINLDGGASSGLWLRGSYLRRPGRLISNALLILPK